MMEQADVVVVGGASAGLAAAVAAKTADAEKVIVLEKAPLDQLGGNCRFSGMGFRFVHDGRDDLMTILSEDDRERYADCHILPYTREDFYNDLQRVTQGKIDQELANILVDDSRDAIDWMTDLGHKWELFHPLEANGEIHFNAGKPVKPMEGGQGLVDRWAKMAAEMGVDLRTESRVSAIDGDYREVRGVRVDGVDGPYEIECSAIILASGGFQASAERRAQYLSAGADAMKVRGSRHNTGEVLQMAIDMGAKTSGQWQGAHASPIDGDADAMEVEHGVNRYGYPYGISVNTDAKRFFDEGEAHRAYTYAKTGWAVLGQPNNLAWQIYDQKGLPYIPSDYVYAKKYEADSIAELAGLVDLDPDALQATVDEFNAAVDGTVPFVASKEDKRGTNGLTPKKTNWAQTLTDPPFAAYKVTGGITFSFGGVEIDRDANVVNTNGDPIRGLYATGDIVGMFYHNYPSCSGMTRNVVFGGRAGAGAAALAAG